MMIPIGEIYAFIIGALAGICSVIFVARIVAAAVQAEKEDW
jgi:hypothetical protein